MEQLSKIHIDNVNTEKKAKTMFVLKAKGSTLSDEVRKMLDKYALEFDQMKN